MTTAPAGDAALALLRQAAELQPFAVGEAIVCRQSGRLYRLLETSVPERPGPDRFRSCPYVLKAEDGSHGFQSDDLGASWLPARYLAQGARCGCAIAANGGGGGMPRCRSRASGAWSWRRARSTRCAARRSSISRPGCGCASPTAASASCRSPPSTPTSPDDAAMPYSAATPRRNPP